MNKFYALFLGLFLLISSSALSAQTALLDWEQTTGETSVFSSARAVDLNNDGVKDFILGGGLESAYLADGSLLQYDSDHMVMAVDGATGDFIWQVPGPDQIYGSPIFRDITGDNIPEVFIGGRNAFFLCIDGATGDINWQFYEGSNGQNASNDGLYNFFNPQWIPDQNGDFMPEILVSNGGDRALPPWETDRPAGLLMVVDPLSGELLASAEMPDGRETYMSPLVYDFFRDSKPDVIIGTGGESIEGNLYRVPLTDVMAGDISNATVLLTTTNKGFIAPPSLADLTQDNIPEIIVNTYEGHCIAIDGWTNDVLWDVTVDGSETNASPAIGLFNEDDIPDVFTSFLIGIAPTYTGVAQIMIDGATGELVYENNLGVVQYSSAVVADLNGDGIDEAIQMINLVEAGNFYHDVIAFDFANGSETSLLDAPVGGTNIAATPWLGNLDNDGSLDLFFSHNSDQNSFNNEDSFTLKKYSLSTPDSIAVAWGGYMGNGGDGFYDNPLGTCYQSIWFLTDISISPTCIGGSNGEAEVNSNGCPCMFNDCEFLWSNGDTLHHAYNLEAGIHYVTLTHEDGCVMVKRVEVDEPEGAQLNYTNISCAGENDGFASVAPINDTTFYSSYLWSTGDTTDSVSGLDAGIYTVEVVSPEGCIETKEFEVEEGVNIGLNVLDYQDNYNCTDTGYNNNISFEVSGNGPFSLSISQISNGPNGTEENDDFFNAESLVEGDILDISLPVFNETVEYIFTLSDNNICEDVYFQTIDNTSYIEDEIEIIFYPFEPEIADCEVVYEATIFIEEIEFGVSGPKNVYSDNEAINVFLAPDFTPYAASITATQAVEGNIYVEYDGNCVRSYPVNITETDFEENTPILETAVNINTITCNDLTTDIMLEISSSSNVEYSLDGTDFSDLDGNVLELQGYSTGEYTVYLQSNQGCALEVPFEIVIPDVLNLISTSPTPSATNESNDGEITLTIEGGTPPYTYTIGETSGEISEAGVQTFDGYGFGEYEVSVTDANDCQIIGETVVVDFINMVGIEDIQNASAHIYPNPSKGDFTLELTSDFQDADVVVYNSVGQRVAFQKTSIGNKNQIQLDAPKSGVYFIEITKDGKRELAKLIVL